MIRIMCGVRLVDKDATDVLCDSVGVVVKIEDMIIQSRLRWYGLPNTTSIPKYVRLLKLK